MQTACTHPTLGPRAASWCKLVALADTSAAAAPSPGPRHLYNFIAWLDSDVFFVRGLAAAYPRILPAACDESTQPAGCWLPCLTPLLSLHPYPLISSPSPSHHTASPSLSACLRLTARPQHVHRCAPPRIRSRLPPRGPSQAHSFTPHRLLFTPRRLVPRQLAMDGLLARQSGILHPSQLAGWCALCHLVTTCNRHTTAPVHALVLSPPPSHAFSPSHIPVHALVGQLVIS